MFIDIFPIGDNKTVRIDYENHTIKLVDNSIDQFVWIEDQALVDDLIMAQSHGDHVDWEQEFDKAFIEPEYKFWCVLAWNKVEMTLPNGKILTSPEPYGHWEYVFCNFNPNEYCERVQMTMFHNKPDLNSIASDFKEILPGAVGDGMIHFIKG